MKKRPRAAFVVTLSAVSLVAGCQKSGVSSSSSGECKPPECHMNPPPPPPPPSAEIQAPPPAPTVPAVSSDAGAARRD